MNVNKLPSMLWIIIVAFASSHNRPTINISLYVCLGSFFHSISHKMITWVNVLLRVHQRNVCVCACVYVCVGGWDRDFFEGIGSHDYGDCKTRICRIDQQAGDPGKGPCCTSEGRLLAAFPRDGGRSGFVLFRPSTDWMRPPHITESNQLYSKSTDWSINHIPEHPHRNGIYNNMWLE